MEKELIKPLFAFVDTDKITVRADLPNLIRLGIGPGMQVGELCAVRWMDLNLTAYPWSPLLVLDLCSSAAP